MGNENSSLKLKGSRRIEIGNSEVDKTLILIIFEETEGGSEYCSVRTMYEKWEERTSKRWKYSISIPEYLEKSSDFDLNEVNDDLGYCKLVWTDKVAEIVKLEKQRLKRAFFKLLESKDEMDLPKIRALVKKYSIDLDNFQNRRGEFPIHTAAKVGRMHMIKYLVEECGVDCKKPNKSGENALMIATKRYNFGHCMKYFTEKLYKPWTIHFFDVTGLTPAFFAIKSGNLENTKFLVNKYNVNKEVVKNAYIVPLSLASMWNRFKIVQWIVDTLDKYIDYNIKNEEGRALLDFVREDEDGKKIRKILSKKMKEAKGRKPIVPKIPTEKEVDEDMKERLVDLFYHENGLLRESSTLLVIQLDNMEINNIPIFLVF